MEHINMTLKKQDNWHPNKDYRQMWDRRAKNQDVLSKLGRVVTLSMSVTKFTSE